MQKYKGIAVSKGIAVGKVFKYSRKKTIIECYNIKDFEIDRELERLDAAKNKANEYLNKIKERAVQELGRTETQIFDAHIYMLNDPVLDQDIKRIIAEDRINADAAIQKAISAVEEKFMQLEDSYFKERVEDIKDVGNHLLKALSGELTNLHDVPENSIIIAEDLTPSETALLDKDHLKGFVLSKGGETSHTAIMAKGLMLPAVVNVGNIMDQVKQNDPVILDALKGEVVVNPSVEEIEKYEGKIDDFKQENRKLLLLKNKSSCTIDGFKVDIAANIATEEELTSVKEVNADGIGLFRTEFLYTNRANFNDEKRQYRIYKKVLEEMSPRTVVIRTLDIGGDKDLSYFRVPEEVNPFLGWRGIRISLEREDIFKSQLRSLLRAGKKGNLKILLPLISSLEELKSVKNIIDKVKQELKKEGADYVSCPEVGMMIEVPSTAVMADVFAKEVDFFSIGTNDLIQYTLAVDRNNNKITNLYSPYHPAVLRLINRVAEAAHHEKIPLALCGEAAANPLLVPIFVAMGINELSMSSTSILEIKNTIRNLSRTESKHYLNNILKLNTAAAVEEYLKKINENLGLKI